MGRRRAVSSFSFGGDPSFQGRPTAVEGEKLGSIFGCSFPLALAKSLSTANPMQLSHMITLSGTKTRGSYLSLLVMSELPNGAAAGAHPVYWPKRTCWVVLFSLAILTLGTVQPGVLIEIVLSMDQFKEK